MPELVGYAVHFECWRVSAQCDFPARDLQGEPSVGKEEILQSSNRSLIARRCLADMDRPVPSRVMPSRCLTSPPTGWSSRGQAPLQRRLGEGSPVEWKERRSDSAHRPKALGERH